MPLRQHGPPWTTPFTVWKRERVISLITPENHRSIRVAERIEETLQGRIHHNGREMLVYGIDRESYERKQGLVSKDGQTS